MTWLENYLLRTEVSKGFKTSFVINIRSNYKTVATVRTRKLAEAIEQFVLISSNYALHHPCRIELNRFDSFPSFMQTLHVLFKPTAQHKAKPCVVCSAASEFNLDGEMLCHQHLLQRLQHIKESI